MWSHFFSMTICSILFHGLLFFFKQPDFFHLLPLQWSHKSFPSIHLLCFLDTFVRPPGPFSSFLWQAPREIVFSTFLMKAAQSCSLLSRLFFGKSPLPPFSVLVVWTGLTALHTAAWPGQSGLRWLANPMRPREIRSWNFPGTMQRCIVFQSKIDI